MSYIEQTLANDEKIEVIAELHWFAYIKEKPEYTFDLDGKDNLFLFKLE